VTINSAVAVDLEILSVKASIDCFVVVESMGVLGPSGDLEVHAE
jgi:hypothetical protein